MGKHIETQVQCQRCLRHKPESQTAFTTVTSYNPPRWSGRNVRVRVCRDEQECNDYCDRVEAGVA